MRLIPLATACVALAAIPLSGQERLSPDEFLNRVEGRTATFVLYRTDAVVGIEQFLSRERSVWARANGSCAYGTIVTDRDQVCFYYDDDPPGVKHCWVPIVYEDRLLVAQADASEVQEVTRINDKPVICEAAPMS